MRRYRCYHCRYEAFYGKETEWLHCGSCDQLFHRDSALGLVAAEVLRERIERHRDLDASLRAELLARIAAHLDGRRRELAALRPPEPEPIQPPPLPETETPPPEPLPEALPPEPSPPPVAPPPSGPPMRPRGPGVWARLGPVFAENVLFFLAGFLLLAGAVFFTTTAWTTMSGSQRQLVIAAGLLVFATLLHVAGRMLGRGKGLRDAERVLLFVAAAMVPATTVVGGLLLDEHWALGVATAVAALIVGALFARHLLRRESVEPRADTWAAPFLALSALSLVAPELDSFRVLATCGLAAALLVTAWAMRRPLRSRALAVPAARFALALSGIAAVAGAATLAVFAPDGTTAVRAVAPLGTLIAALAASAVLVESAHRKRAPGSLLLAALATAVAGAAIASGDLRCLMVAAWLGAGIGVHASLRLDRAYLLVLGLALSVIGYLFLPAPVRELAQQLRDQAASSLGYEPQRLPLSFYGVSFLPYLALLGGLVFWLQRRERQRHRGVARNWLLAVAGGLAAMSLVLGDDLRAPLVVLFADGALLVGIGYLTRSAAAVFAGQLGLLGGLICLLAYLDAAAGVVTAAGTAAGLVLIGLGRGAPNETTATADPAFPARLLRAHRAAAVVAAGGLLLWLGLCLPGTLARPVGLDVLHGTAVVLFAALVRRAPAGWAPVPALACLPPLLLGALGIPALLGGDPLLWRSASLAVPAALLVLGWRPLVATLVERQQRITVSLLGAALVLVQLLALPPIVQLWPRLPWPVPAGVAAGAVTLAAWAVRAKTPWLLGVSLVHLAAATVLTVAAIGHDPGGTPGALGVALIAAGGLLAGRRDRLGLLPVRGVAAVLALGSAGWVAALRIAALPDTPNAEHAWAGLGAVAAIVLVLVPRLPRLRSADRPEDVLVTAAGSLAALLVPVLALDLLATGPLGYAAGFLGVGLLAAGVTWALRADLARLVAFAVGLGYAGLALMIALLARPQDTDEAWLRAALLVGAAVPPLLGRRVSEAVQPLASLLAVLAIASAGLVALGDDLLYPPEYRPAALMALCAVLSAVTAAPPLLRHRTGVRIFCIPALLLAGIGLAVLALDVFFQEPSRTALSGSQRSGLDLAAALFAVAVAVHAFTGRPTARVSPGALVGAAVLLALFATAPINALLHADRARFWRPDVECALLALAMAFFVPVRRTELCHGLALLALALTVAAFAHLSTPLTVTAVAAVPLVLALRRAPGAHLLWHGVGVLAAVWAWILYAALPGAERALAPVIAAATAALGWGLSPYLRDLARRTGAEAPSFPSDTGIAVLCWLLSSTALGYHAVRYAGSTEGVTLTLLALASCGLAGTRMARLCRMPGQAPWVHLALGSGVLAWVYVALLTDWLAALADVQHHGFALLGGTLLLAVGRGTTPVRRQLLLAGTVLPVLTLLLLPVFGGATFALFLAAVVYGLGTATSGIRALGAVSLVLLNAALYSLWIAEDVWDPSYYGVPAGLSLLLGTELSRAALQPRVVQGLRIVGLSLVYGSVAVQVARVEEPFHAVVLFLLALFAVLWGFLRKQTVFLLAGTAAVVLDVVAYLFQRGFARDFVGSLLLVGAGATVLAVAALTARRRARRGEP